MLSLIEKGKRLPGREYLPAIAACLGCDYAEVVAMIHQEKIMRSWTESNVGGTPKSIDPPYLSIDDLERSATKQRERFLKLANRSRIEFPADRERVAELLANLRVRYVDGVGGAKMTSTRYLPDYSLTAFLTTARRE